VAGADSAKDGRPIEFWEHPIQEHEVDATGFNRLCARETIERLGDTKAIEAEAFREEVVQVLLVFNNEDVLHGSIVALAVETAQGRL